jgi:RNA-binding protein
MSKVWNDQTLPDDQREASEQRKRNMLTRKSSIIKPKIWIGKTGISEAFIDTLNKQLKSDKLVKIKVQKGASESQTIDEISKAAAAATGATLIDARGRTFTLYKAKAAEKEKLL